MKVVFLDIDGVLNTSETYDRIDKENLENGTSNIYIDGFRVEYLSKIVELTDAKIVLSSSLRWRFQKKNDKVVPITEYFADDFINMLAGYNLFLYDLIPIIRDVNGREIKRQEEIKIWLSQNENVENFVILDDETTELMDFVDDNFIILNNLPIGVMVRDMRDCVGLCEEHIEQVVDILNSKRNNNKVKIRK